MTSEKKLQAKLIKEYEQAGWYVLKLAKTNKNGIPDLLMLKPNQVKFIEVKGDNGVVSPVQKYRLKELKNLGFDAEIKFPEK